MRATDPAASQSFTAPIVKSPGQADEDASDGDSFRFAPPRPAPVVLSPDDSTPGAEVPGEDSPRPWGISTERIEVRDGTVVPPMGAQRASASGAIERAAIDLKGPLSHNEGTSPKTDDASSPDPSTLATAEMEPHTPSAASSARSLCSASVSDTRSCALRSVPTSTS